MPRPSFLAVLALAAGAVYANTHMGQHADSELSPQGQAAQAVFADPLGSAPIGVGQGGPSLADALTVERRASLWFEYARDVSSIVSMLAVHMFSSPPRGIWHDVGLAPCWAPRQQSGGCASGRGRGVAQLAAFGR